MTTRNIKYKYDRYDKVMWLSFYIPATIGAVLIIVNMIQSYSDELYFIGFALLGFSMGVSFGLFLMRRALLKWLTEIGVFRIEGTQGKETITFIPIEQAYEPKFDDQKGKWIK